MGTLATNCLIFTDRHVRSSDRSCSVKKGFLKNFADFTGKHLYVSLFLIKLPEGLQLYLKETPTQLFSCEICQIFEDTYFDEYLRTVASLYYILPRVFFNIYLLLFAVAVVFAVVAFTLSMFEFWYIVVSYLIH